MATIKEKQEEIIKLFEELSDWEEKYSLIIKFGKELPPMPEGTKVEKNKIEGCQSQVWLYAKFEDGKIFLFADSDTVIVKGLAALLVKVYSGHTPGEILSAPPEFLSKIGVTSHLSPTRQNGLSAMVKQIQLFAIAFKTLSK